VLAVVKRMKRYMFLPFLVTLFSWWFWCWLFYRLYAKTPVSRKYLLVAAQVLDGEGFMVMALLIK